MYSLTLREFKSIKDKLKDAITQYYRLTCNIGIEARNIAFNNLVSDDDQVETLSIFEFDNCGYVTSQYLPLVYDSINNCWVTLYSNNITAVGLGIVIHNTIKQMRYKNLSDSVGNAVTIREMEELFD